MQAAWINPKGRIIEVSDHFNAIKETPRLYNMAVVPEDRDQALKQAMRNGFIRVRQHPGYITFEFYGYTMDVMIRIMKYIVKEKMWDSDRIMISDIKSGRYSEFTIGELKDPEKMEKYHLNKPKRKKSPWQKFAHEDLWHLKLRRK